MVTNLALGTAPLGNLFQPVPGDEALAVLRGAFDAGLAHVDTAPHYGVGLAEECIGQALAAVSRSEVTVATKVGRRLFPVDPARATSAEGFVQTPSRERRWDLSRDGVRRSLDESLERMGIDRVDVLYLHDPDDHDV